MKEVICFDFICDESLIFSDAAKKIRDAGGKVCGISLGNRWKQAWNDFRVYSLELDECHDIDWEKELKRISKRYMQYAPASFTQADRFICNLPREQQKKILVYTFLKIEEIVKTGVTAFVTTGVAYLYNLVILAVCGVHSIKAISLYGARQPEPRFVYSLSKGGIWDKVNQCYIQLQNDKSLNLTEEIAYIKSFREKAKKPDYMNSARQQGGIRWVFVKEFISRLKKWYLDKWNHPGDYITQHPVWYVSRDVKRILNKRYINLIFSFDEHQVEDDFFIYPLHLQPEASTLVLGDDYVDQLNTIKAIAKRLPANKLLYVKEHPAAFGRHSLAFYKEVKKIYNVKLIHCNEDSHQLILNSNAVIVVSGTMGWEALLLGVPAIVLGSVFYESFNGSFKIESLSQLSELLQSELACDMSLDDIAISLKAIKLGSYQGRFDVHKIDTVDKVLSSENLELMHSGLLKALE